jgi:hypothetical protein
LVGISQPGYAPTGAGVGVGEGVGVGVGEGEGVGVGEGEGDGLPGPFEHSFTPPAILPPNVVWLHTKVPLRTL